jgi:hypothetical protein
VATFQNERVGLRFGAGRRLATPRPAGGVGCAPKQDAVSTRLDLPPLQARARTRAVGGCARTEVPARRTRARERGSECA